MTRRILIVAGVAGGLAVAIAAPPTLTTLAIVAGVCPLLIALGVLGLERELNRARARRRPRRRAGYIHPR